MPLSLEEARCTVPSTPDTSESSYSVPVLADDSTSLQKPQGFRAGVGLENVARRTLGIILLLITVILWTTSNFLASYIFADDTYSKPYFVTYFNTAFFAISLVPILLRIAQRDGLCKISLPVWSKWCRQDHGNDRRRVSGNDERSQSNAPLLEDNASEDGNDRSSSRRFEGGVVACDVLNVRETAVLSLEFSLLWFLANYFVAACLEYTSVASSTILTSTSSIWTLLFGAILHVEKFTYKKLVGVLASLTGIILISMVDLSGDNDRNRGSFPHKSQRELAIGDILAFVSAVLYGAYSVVMKKRVENEDRVNMPLFFGLVGLFNLILLWPGFIVLHLTGIETFELPPTGKIWTIIILNSASSFVSDYCWAYAMLLTTPLVVTVGLSLTIPLSLVGQMVLSSQYSSGLYWLGAVVVVVSFLFINHESHEIAGDGVEVT